MKKFISIKNWLNEQKKEQTYGCVMLDSKISDWEEKHIGGIDPKDVYIKPYDDSYGLEDNPHVTIIYGIHEDEIDPEVVMEVIKKNMKPVTVTIDNISIFSKNEYDVVKYDVPVTDQLKEYRNKFEKTFPNTQTFPEYHPHITLAYVKPGEGQKYIKKLDEPFEVTFGKGVYSFHDEEGNQIKKEYVFPTADNEEIDLSKVNEWFIPDLEPYNYGYIENNKKINPKELAVGWLDNPDFPKGDVPLNFFEKLKNAKLFKSHKGGHDCPFCTEISGGSSSDARSSRVYAIEYNGIKYIFPALLTHYIKVHHYRPPKEFINAVMNSEPIEQNPLKIIKRFK